ncbi:peptidoglycan/xylan/chitin deacetylase (PgdA/CDA1 family) [Actinoplanes lutulentus]|uniref:Peptidoglycan/xylan/chitin deacetylase (PgdA/CDA1 family) n=1 Tax=Actinoplanes lutulentus TaxID=1287878 RepID=A0A327ZKU1_9ACTN|nr:polysaccharide deacetylase family protein [Actinoplanes lutulentus]MBB2940689.1 peptidoglycan/xylan/chitin deacetylase (PgdA/CDA1 family) [Actinoplanes lutulentus]RAK43000.1 peptidoglycan/xylan/chitin deacetylase (PgdA/CDA1 family) [Actinoplanes lutulentus]
MRNRATFAAVLVLGTVIVVAARNNDEVPVPPVPVAAAVSFQPAVAGYETVASAKKRTIALTFDDGPSKYTPQILDILKRQKVKATFCMLGNNVGQYRKTAKRVVREGHRLCNHSRNHPDFTTLTRSQARSQVRFTQRKIREVTGRAPRTFRFPYGASNRTTRAVVRDEGLRILGWTVDTRDWQRPGAAVITRRAVRGARPGGVVLMHDGGGDRRQTVASLENTIRKLKAAGYTFVLA